MECGEWGGGGMECVESEVVESVRSEVECVRSEVVECVRE